MHEFLARILSPRGLVELQHGGILEHEHRHSGHQMVDKRCLAAFDRIIDAGEDGSNDVEKIRRTQAATEPKISGR